MKGDLTGILRFRIIGYQEMLSFLISRHCFEPYKRQLMSFALRLIKKIELKTLTDFFFLYDSGHLLPLIQKNMLVIGLFCLAPSSYSDTSPRKRCQNQ